MTGRVRYTLDIFSYMHKALSVFVLMVENVEAHRLEVHGKSSPIVN